MFQIIKAISNIFEINYFQGMADSRRRYSTDKTGDPERERRIFFDHAVLRRQSVESSFER